MNSRDRYIANLIFGSIRGIKYNKKNLILASSDPSGHRILNTSTSQYTEKFIKILSSNEIEYFQVDSTSLGLGLIRRQCNLEEFWNLTKDRKSKFIIIFD